MLLRTVSIQLCTAAFAKKIDRTALSYRNESETNGKFELILSSIAAVHLKKKNVITSKFNSRTMDFSNFPVSTDVPGDNIECFVLRKETVSPSPRDAFSFITFGYSMRDTVLNCYTLFFL